MAGLTWELNLTDHVSTPAANIARVLKAVVAELLGVRKAAKALGPVIDRLGNSFFAAGSKVSAFGKPIHRLEAQLLDFDRRGARAAVNGLQSIGNAAVATGRQVSALHTQFSRPFTPRGGGGGAPGRRGNGVNLLVGLSAASTGLQYGRAALGMAEGFAHAALSLGEMVLKQAEFKRGIVGSFTGELGSAKAAEAYYQQLQGLSDRGSLKMTDIAPSAHAIMRVRGMDSEKAARFTEALSDMMANTTVDPQKFKQLTGVAVRGLTGSTIGPRMFSQFIGHIPGFSQDNLTLALAHSRGISESRAEGLFKSKNKATKEEAFFDAMTQFAKERSAQFGGSATDYFGRRSSTSQVTTFQDRVMSVFRDVDTSPFALAMAGINDALKDGTPLMASFKSTANSLFQDVLEPWISAYRGDAGKLTQDLTGLQQAFAVAGHAAVGFSSILHDMAMGLIPTGRENNPYYQDRAASGFAGNLAGGIAGGSLAATVGFVLGNAIFPGLGLLTGPGLGMLGAWGGSRTGQAFSESVYDDKSESPEQAASRKSEFGDFSHSGNIDSPFALPGHAAGGFTTADHPAMVHKNEAILPLDDVPRILGAAMSQAGGGGAGRGSITVIVNVSGTGMDAEAVGDVVARVVPIQLQSFLERSAIGLTGGFA